MLQDVWPVLTIQRAFIWEKYNYFIIKLVYDTDSTGSYV